MTTKENRAKGIKTITSLLAAMAPAAIFAITALLWTSLLPAIIGLSTIISWQYKRYLKNLEKIKERATKEAAHIFALP